MKNQKHPKYQYVVFQDSGADFTILTKSTATSDETIKWEDGEEYPLIKVEISSASHPFYTGKQKIVDTENRVKTFEKKIKSANTEVLEAKKQKRRARRAKVDAIKAGKRVTLTDMLNDL
ncbi:type B 50S ribosomal protein L31 [Candidatus Dojkabacteria bacterium]|nr:type B 50S ribosomal protein L31 [Candidatus Dojkabacteria bacterium]